jgi:chemotaxis protein histidine kinase CheA
MAIYRGVGGAGEANDDATLNAVTEKAQDAATSASEAATSATSAASSATTATTKASEASTSASNAASSASSASTSATAAASSATSASSSATTATTKASEASTSATNAATSATAAASSATSASSSATTATTKASEAATSASAASTSATAAASSASSASTSATAAAGSATSAASSATSASSAQTAAEAARDSALSALDNFDDRYLGQKTSDPTTDNDGDALVTGALYFNTTNDIMKVYEGSAWVPAYASFSSFDTDDLTEGSTNLYYTDARAQAVSINNVVEDTTPQLGGNLDANGFTIAGRNVATDGTKLDGIETGATADQTAQEIATAIDADTTAEATLKTALGLGSAAYTPTSDYATAAQGTSADTAYGWGDHSTQGYATETYATGEALALAIALG